MVEVLLARASQFIAGKATYMADKPLLPGVRWFRIELSLSAAIMNAFK